MVDYSEQGRRSKRRGKTYERRAAKLLTEFTDIGFRSTPSSGGFNKQGGVVIREELFCGDVICDNPNFLFCVEAKNRKSFSFTALLKNSDTAEFSKWWYQCVEDAHKVHMLPIMFFKPDNQADFVALDVCGFQVVNPREELPHFKLSVYDRAATLKIRGRYNKKTSIIYTILPTAFIMNWKVIADNVDSKLFFKS